MPPKKAVAKKVQVRTFERLLTGNKKFGAHVGMSGGVYKAVTNAITIGSNSFALFLKSPRRWESPAITDKDAKTFKDLCKEHGYNPRTDILPHGSYFINMANPDDEKWEKSFNCLLDDLKRCEQLDIGHYNFHPGSSLGENVPIKDENDILASPGVRKLASGLNKAMKETEFVRIVVENMAGHGSYVCGNLDDFHALFQLLDDPKRVGICIDTCHSFAAGYDLSNEDSWNAFWKEFEEKVGFEHLASMHLNDSMAPLGANRDLHQKLGWGFLGLECFRLLANDKRLDNIPLILETPIEDGSESGYGEEIKLLEWLVGKEKDDPEFLAKSEELQKLGYKSRQEQAEKFEKKQATKRKAEAKAEEKATGKGDITKLRRSAAKRFKTI
ncbi:DNA-(apurinic or apyrimidinic site) lyase [Pichia kluyveri]|uniref:Apurinic-apyrimidinic endonuclease 1 n=1 Tax=Pichia kluyveri TaxID=36015 RepID=A0AAV5R8N0_PICKL|nr:DNA-(apurinic or apyrimidinic site) lyase [Pichia kluyveri]